MQVVQSFDGLPTRSSSASKLTIHFTCTSVAKPKEVSQKTYKHLYLNVSLLIEAYIEVLTGMLSINVEPRLQMSSHIYKCGDDKLS